MALTTEWLREMLREENYEAMWEGGGRYTGGRDRNYKL